MSGRGLRLAPERWVPRSGAEPGPRAFAVPGLERPILFACGTDARVRLGPGHAEFSRPSGLIDFGFATPDFDPPSTVTISAWVRCDSLSAGAILLSRMSSALERSSWSLEVGPGLELRVRLFGFSSATGRYSEQRFETEESVANDQWMHLAFVLHNRRVRVLLNGVLQVLRAVPDPSVLGQLTQSPESLARLVAGGRANALPFPSGGPRGLVDELAPSPTSAGYQPPFGPLLPPGGELGHGPRSVAFVGGLAQLGYFHRCLTDDETRQVMISGYAAARDLGPVGYWPLQRDFADVHGRHHGTAHGAVAVNSGRDSGVIQWNRNRIANCSSLPANRGRIASGAALDFDWTDQLPLGHSERYVVEPGEDFALSLWLELGATNLSMVIAQLGDSTGTGSLNSGWRLEYVVQTQPVLRLTVADGSAAPVVVEHPVHIDQEWHHYAVWVQPDGFAVIAKDMKPGKPQAVPALDRLPVTPTLWIGGAPGAPGLKGALSDVRLFRRLAGARSPVEALFGAFLDPESIPVPRGGPSELQGVASLDAGRVPVCWAPLVEGVSTDLCSGHVPGAVAVPSELSWVKGQPRIRQLAVSSWTKQVFTRPKFEMFSAMSTTLPLRSRPLTLVAFVDAQVRSSSNIGEAPIIGCAESSFEPWELRLDIGGQIRCHYDLPSGPVRSSPLGLFGGGAVAVVAASFEPGTGKLSLRVGDASLVETFSGPSAGLIDSVYVGGGSPIPGSVSCDGDIFAAVMFDRALDLAELMRIPADEAVRNIPDGGAATLAALSSLTDAPAACWVLRFGPSLLDANQGQWVNIAPGSSSFPLYPGLFQPRQERTCLAPIDGGLARRYGGAQPFVSPSVAGASRVFRPQYPLNLGALDRAALPGSERVVFGSPGAVARRGLCHKPPDLRPEMTIDAWIRDLKLSPRGTILSVMGADELSTASTPLFRFAWERGNLVFESDAGSVALRFPRGGDATAWHHVAVQWRGGSATRLWVDGRDIGAGVSPELLPVPWRAEVGSHTDAYVADVRVHATAVGVTRIPDLMRMPGPPRLVG